MNPIMMMLGDSATIARRNLRKVTRVPEILIGITISPILMLVLFA